MIESGLQRETWRHRLERIFNWLSRLQFEEGQVGQVIEAHIPGIELRASFLALPGVPMALGSIEIES
jgi:hypothetical protein